MASAKTKVRVMFVQRKTGGQWTGSKALAPSQLESLRGDSRLRALRCVGPQQQNEAGCGEHTAARVGDRGARVRGSHAVVARHEVALRARVLASLTDGDDRERGRDTEADRTRA